MIGCGGISEQHLAAYRRMGLEVVALCNRDVSKADARAAQFYPEAQTFSRHDDFLAHADVEVVDVGELAGFGQQVALHVAAAGPLYLDETHVPSDDVERESAVLREQALASGKPENIVEKIVDGRINKWYGEVCLMEQVWIKDTDVKINKLLSKISQELGGEITIKGFERFKVGEGIEKREDDLAAEVAKMTQG